mgnify:FL=1|jgi:hypothetical protein
MGRERRGAPRYVVDDLSASLNDVPHAILDVAVSSVRVLRRPGWEPAPVHVTLGLWGEVEATQTDFRCPAFLIRETRNELVYGFDAPAPHWSWQLPLFDTFKDHRIAELED